MGSDSWPLYSACLYMPPDTVLRISSRQLRYLSRCRQIDQDIGIDRRPDLLQLMWDNAQVRTIVKTNRKAPISLNPTARANPSNSDKEKHDCLNHHDTGNQQQQQVTRNNNRWYATTTLGYQQQVTKNNSR